MLEKHPSELIRRRRKIAGMSAVLLPMTELGEIDWSSFRGLLERTVRAGLVPAVNMDTGYVQLISESAREQVLDTTKSVVGEEFVAGAHVEDHEGDSWDRDAMAREMERIESRGGTPVVFPSYGLTALDGPDWAGAHKRLGESSDRFIGFELGPMFVPYGRIYDLEAYRALLAIPQCIGAKHSSLSRSQEWERLALRDSVRPDFRVLTGNDLAIDMVMYGSDYLLGLSAFAPEAFAKRDGFWATDDPMFYELNDLLQYLGFFAFRDPVPAYKHDAAIFLNLRKRISSPETHPQAARRPASDREVLEEISKATRGLGMSRAVKMTRLGTREKLEARLAELGLSLPIDDEIEEEGPLSHAFDVGGRSVGNRFAVLPMEGWDASPDGRPTDLVKRRWSRFGESGAKLVWGGEAYAVQPEARAKSSAALCES